MSVTSAMFSGISGLLANAEGINVIGNNLSNVNTVGFKGSRMLFSDMLSTDIGNNSQVGHGTQIQKVDNDFGQGAFESTTSASDVALQGPGFFRVQSPATSTNYLTRAGSFRLDSSGNLVNPDGYYVLDSTGTKITLTNPAKIVSIDNTGLITYQNTAGASVTGPKLDVVTVTNPSGLQKAGGTLFSENSAAGTVTNAAADGTTNKVFSNSLEQSNVDMATQFVKMILTQRAYSANSKTITTADQMTQEVLNLKQ